MIFLPRQEIVGIGKDFVEFSNKVRTWSYLIDNLDDSFGLTGPFQVGSCAVAVFSARAKWG